ncbi:MAG: amino acid lyase [Acidobacteria bacterium]|nr:MAG: amino acid lyase [Acidobacteriota bacterium]
MARVDRRQFFRIGGLASGIAAGLPRVALGDAIDDRADRDVRLSGDGVGLTPTQYAGLLNQLVEAAGFAPDSYSLGGIVDQLEDECARVLGKERAIFMPTGTLANHMAVRALAGGSSRVIVQEESHFYQDEGDCAQTLSALTLIPLAPGRATFSADDVQRVIDQTKAGRVVSRVSAISIESPVRRKQGERFDPIELRKIIALARREGIRLHLDGARLFLQAAYTGESVADYARPFDTVYVSLYKYFNAASGAILAGPRALLDGMYHGRRMFGGGLNQVWPFALVARHYLDGFSDRYSRAVRTSEEWIRALGRHGAFTIDRVPSGTNLFRLRVSGTDPASLQRRLASARVMLAPPQNGAFLIGVNETLNRTSAADLTETFVRALAG